MSGPLTLAAIAALYAARGGETYGEDVTQVEHALQCAGLAAASGAAPALIAAALLHDIGHLLDEPAGGVPHEVVGVDALRPLFGAEVCGPIALHVAAKRYLCFAEPAYAAGLSRASQQSLVVQGGAFDAAAAAAFVRLPHAAAAVALRRFDDSGKREHAAADRIFADYLPLLASLLVRLEPAR